MLSLKGSVQGHIGLLRSKDWGSLPLVAFDTETDGLHGPLVVAAFANAKEAYTMEPQTLYLGDLVGAVVAGHHLAYDLRTLMRAGVDFPPCVFFDTSVAEHLLDENVAYPDLGGLAQKYLGMTLKSWEDVKDDPVALRAYARDDARATYGIARIQWTLLEEQGLLDYFLKLEMPLVPVIADMEHRGIRVDLPEVARRARTSTETRDRLHQELREILHDYDWTCHREGCIDGVYHYKRGSRTSTCGECAGTGLNPVVLTSGDYQIDILYNHLGLEPLAGKGAKTTTGKLSTNRDTLLRLRSAAVVSENERAVKYINVLLEYRKHAKLLSTYYGKWLEIGTERLHPSFHQTGTVSGRWSSSNPNFQNVPPEVRPCILPDEGYAFISVDYTQIELYLLGLLSGERNIVAAYESGADMHQATADLLRISRADCKTINFALVYGLGLESLAVKLASTIEHAEEIYDRVLSQFTNLNPFKVKVVNDVKRRGYSTTLLGRRRRLPDLTVRNKWLRFRAERQAVNHKIQGSAGDLIKCATIKALLTIPDIQPVLQIHDEVVWQVPKALAGVRAEQLRQCFETANRQVKPRAEAVVMADRWEAK